MTKTVRQDARRSGKEDAGHSLFLGGCLFGFHGEHNSKIRKGSCRDVTCAPLYGGQAWAHNQGKPELDKHDENCTAGR